MQSYSRLKRPVLKQTGLQQIVLPGLAMVTFLLSGCSWLDSTFPDPKKVDYKISRTESPLEVPPDLTRPNRDDTMAVPDISPSGAATYSAYSGERKGGGSYTSSVMPEQDQVRYVREGGFSWLVLQGEPAQVWPKIREFWLHNGFLLTRDDPAIGILETDWSENRADIPQGAIRRLLSKALDSIYSAATRDKFRVRLEKGRASGTTELFISHRGMEEFIPGDDTDNASMWKPRASDPELEIEMLKRMMVFVGIEEQKATRLLARKDTQKPRATLVRDADQNISLQLDEVFSRAWRHVGLALDRVGFGVEDRNRSEGLYYVRYNDPDKESGEKEGFFASLAFWSSDEEISDEIYQISVKSEGAATQLLVMDKDGKRDNSDTAQRILNLLHEQLK